MRLPLPRIPRCPLRQLLPEPRAPLDTRRPALRRLGGPMNGRCPELIASGNGYAQCHRSAGLMPGLCLNGCGNAETYCPGCTSLQCLTCRPCECGEAYGRLGP